MKEGDEVGWGKGVIYIIGYLLCYNIYSCLSHMFVKSLVHDC